MSTPIWQRAIRQLFPACPKSRKRTPSCRQLGWRMRLEELESRLAPAWFAVNAQLEVSRLDGSGDTVDGSHAVVFFESSVMDYRVLRQGLAAGTDAVVLDSGGDG